MSDSIKVKKKEYIISSDLERCANEIIVDKKIDINPAKIKYVLVYPEINKTTAGRCTRASNLLKLFGDVDYVIEMSGLLWENLDENRRKILMWHELLHVFPTVNKNGENIFRLREHDVTEFMVIIKEHGIQWFDDLRNLFASVYDLEPSEIDRFHL